MLVQHLDFVVLDIGDIKSIAGYCNVDWLELTGTTISLNESVASIEYQDLIAPGIGAGWCWVVLGV